MNISHGHLIILLKVKSLFWLILVVKENLLNNYAHLNIRHFSLQAFMNNYISVINY